MTPQNTIDLRVDSILPDLRTNSRSLVLTALADEAARLSGIASEVILAQLLEGEQRGSSGIGKGVAIPDLRLKDLHEPLVIFARTATLVDFNALDGQPVNLVFLIASPETDGPHHLRRVARLSRLTRDERFRTRLRDAESRDVLEILFMEPTAYPMAA